VRQSLLLLHLVAMRVLHKADSGRERWTVHVIGQPTDIHRAASPDGQVEDLLRDLGHTVEQSAAAAQNDA